MSETYYRPHDLTRSPEMGKERPELRAKFLDYSAKARVRPLQPDRVG